MRSKSHIYFSIFLLLSGVLLLSAVPLARAQQEKPDEPERVVTLTINVTTYKWWLIRYSDNQVVCTVLTEHEGLPTFADIDYHCGPTISRQWENSEPCPYSGEQIHECSGFYLHSLGSGQDQREVEVVLPLPQVYLSLEGCTPQPPQNTCSTNPSLVFTAEEPLPNEQVIRIQGLIGSKPFSCPGNQCSLPLQPTGEEGQIIEFWADSSYGDSSEHFTGKVRLVPWGDFMAPEEQSSDQPLWYVDVLSSQWRGPQPASCSDVWQVFPDLKGPAAWLTSPSNPTDLASNLSYYYLAGMLIRQGLVDAGQCPNYGLREDNSSIANECGVQAAGEAVIAWQNTFDADILAVSAETGVPAQLLKNVFSRESQFWPGIYTRFEEAGFGQMTEKGADVVLLWNPSFFDQFCPLVLGSEICRLGFGNIGTNYQNMLRGALVSTVNATCLDCPMGIDLSQANFSIKVFAEALLANCVQVEQIVYNTTTKSAGELSSYEDLWRFTLVNYNAGPGCLSDAIEQTLLYRQELNWENVSNNMDEVCQTSVDYVNSISQAPRPTPTPTPWLNSNTYVQPEYDPLPTPTPLPPPTQEPY
jgi:hypothetical protein